MKTAINAGLGILVALALASAHAGAGEDRLGKPEKATPVTLATVAYDKPGPWDYSSPPENGARPYRVGSGDADAPSPRRTSAAPQAKKPVLPQPGNGAMILAGLLAVGAIARRRMSA